MVEYYRRDPYVVAAAVLIIAVVLCLVTFLVVLALTRDSEEADSETIEVTETVPPTLTPGATFTPTVVSATSVPAVGPGQTLPTAAPLVVSGDCTVQAGWVT